MECEYITTLHIERGMVPEERKSDNGLIISFEDRTYSYLNCKEPAIQNINLTISPGEIILIAGPSGCGKSTLLRSINGLIPHMYPGNSSGKVSIDGLSVDKTSITEIAKKVGFVFQNPENQIFMFSVERDVAFGLENLGVQREKIREKVDWAIQLLGIDQLANHPPHELSDGQKQRVALAGVLAMRPRILILDEPTSLLDPFTALELVEIIKNLNQNLGITVLIVEHRLDLLINIATRIICMNKGEILYDGEPRKVLAEKELPRIGVGIPTIAHLHRILSEEKPIFGEIPLSSDELAKSLNVVLK